MAPAPSGDDWRSSDTYCRWAVSLSDRGWAWEFLRRNPHYRAQASHMPPHKLVDIDRVQLDADTTAQNAAAPWGLLCFRGSTLRCARRGCLLAAGDVLIGPANDRFAASPSEFNDIDPTQGTCLPSHRSRRNESAPPYPLLASRAGATARSARHN